MSFAVTIEKEIGGATSRQDISRIVQTVPPYTVGNGLPDTAS